MATIKAKGKTKYGKMDIVISGEHMVEKIYSPDVGSVGFVHKLIHGSYGWMANGYHPEPDTMLQAYATCSLLFNPDDIEVDGEIEEMENDPGVIY